MTATLEGLVEEDLQLGISTVSVTMPAGGSSTGHEINLRTLTDGNYGSAVWNPASVSPGSYTSTTVAVANAALGDFCLAAFSLDLQLMQICACVSAPGTVTVTLYNNTAGAINLAQGAVKVLVFKTP